MEKALKKFLGSCFIFLTLALAAEVPAILISDHAAPQERTAAGELADYIFKITGERPSVMAENRRQGPGPAIYVGNTQFAAKNQLDSTKFTSDEWLLQSRGDHLIVTGGLPRGILYAVYHYLEDFLNVRFWSWKEETVPVRAGVPLKNINVRGKPAFDYRELCSLHVKDSGRFAARLKLNSTRGNYYGQMDPAEKRNFGMESIFGPPDFVHTFHLYIPYRKYFREHPEYFAMVGGKRTGADCTPATNAKAGSLCLSDSGLRRELLVNLKKFIRTGRAEARKRGTAMPRLYDVSSNDNQVVCECPKCSEIIRKYQGLSGLYLEVINELADGIREEFPEVILHTYSYLKTTHAPVGITARNNVCVTLCDHDGNLYDDYTAPNHAFVRRLRQWKQAVPQLRTWVYGLTFAPPRGLPYPSEFKYAEAMKVFRRNGVRWLMQQFESPILNDSWDYKLWIWAKLAENPDLDTWKLIREFSDGYYGAAGKYFAEYRKLLYEQAEKKRICIPVYATPGAFVHLDYDTVVKSDELFRKGEQAIASNPVLMRRWRAARLPLDRAILARSRILMSEYFLRSGKSLKGYAFDRGKIAERIENTVREQLKWRSDMVLMAGDARRFQAEKKGYSRTISERSLMPPEKFAGLAPGSYFDFPAEVAFRPGNRPVLREDPEAESGCGVFWNVKQTENQPHVDNQIFRWGMYSPSEHQSWGIKTLPWDRIGWKGYRWINLGKYKLEPDCFLYFFFTWQIQMSVGHVGNPFAPEGLYEIWAKVKLVGEDENHRPLEVGIDRIVILPPGKE